LLRLAALALFMPAIAVLFLLAVLACLTLINVLARLSRGMSHA
jgi:hypothetical protein